jgi:hypothetical protein
MVTATLSVSMMMPHAHVVVLASVTMTTLILTMMIGTLAVAM